MVSRFLGQDLASVDQLLNERVVPGHLENLSCTDNVDPGVSRISVGGSNDRIAHLCGRSLSYGSSRQGHRPPRRRPPLNAIVMYGPLPGLYTNATTSPSVSSSRLNPGICRYVLPPSCDMAVPFRLPKSSIQHRPFPSFRILA